MRYIFLLTLLGLIACENDDLNKAVLFSGLVIDADSPDKVPLQGMKIDLLVPTSISGDSTLNSTTTDSNGRYSFSIESLSDKFKFYKVEISDEYYNSCNELLTPDMTVSGHKTIQTHSENVWDLHACITCKVETNVTRESTLTKDTINIIVSTKYSDGTSLTDLNPIIVTDNKKWTEVYYYNFARSVKYRIELKKENGDIVSWTEEKELIPKETVKFNIVF